MNRGRLAVLAAALAFAALPASPALARAATPAGDASPPPGGWTLTLVGKKKVVLPIAKVPARFAWNGAKAGDINPTLRYVYKGQRLQRLLGLVDGGKPSFNVARAKKGYKIRLICLDGYKPTFSSRILFKKGKLRTDLIVAKRKMVDSVLQPLPEAEAPFRLVGGPPITQPFDNKLSARGIVRIRLIF